MFIELVCKIYVQAADDFCSILIELAQLVILKLWVSHYTYAITKLSVIGFKSIKAARYLVNQNGRKTVCGIQQMSHKFSKSWNVKNVNIVLKPQQI